MTRLHCHTFFPSQDIKQNVFLSSYLDNWWHHELQDLSLISLQSNGWQIEKEGRTEIQKFEYPKNKKSFLDEIKSIFHSFWRAIIRWKNKNLMKIADTSFNKKQNIKNISDMLFKNKLSKQQIFTRLWNTSAASIFM